LQYLYGLDLSMEQTGVTIFDLDTKLPIHICSISTNKNLSHGMRLYVIAKTFTNLKERFPPKLIAIERGFSRFPTSTQVIFRVHGVANLFFRDVEQIYYPPKTIKECILKGGSTKVQVRKRIEETYPDTVFANEDESDSFAIGLTYLIKNNFITWEKPEKVKKPKVKKVKVEK
jgi:Holliday junction resolvasome RuvABC endonuclease subunit